ncbi:MAG TPA: PstS family phosphate ABC transporter substrate-binding protein [Ornithinibacter sp.]|nr:PstS family phosphate ABC transporter substrate-binding protein [Ornithinibacter sp.]HOB81139.1 PstS family phosphate ABC transporter substrate-binding protein [Ornithinibacter sp.]HPV89730.1 PstS family phosphate ABC transporter substrate-binding protein [Ornithinibacter sp.]HQA14708.1 PstS family phosphate ABC transporter substrate-binding protein [Ornithinibacter sp.]
MKIQRFGGSAAFVLAGALALSACGGQEAESGSGATGADGAAALSGAISSDGSSTVGPLTESAAELFMGENGGVQITVGTSGTGGGFKKFCEGQTQLSNASRPIKDEEKAACAANGIDFQELVVANDAMTVVVNKENTFAKCLTVQELNTMWAPEATGKIMKWNQVNPAFPADNLKLYGPGTDSGTFDYFTDEINGEEGASRTDYEPSEDDNIIVQGVSGDKNALGYFGFTFFEENADKLNAVEIDNGEGCVAPSSETARDGSYAPLSRPLFIYVDKKAFAENAALKSFVNFFIENDTAIAEAAQYIPLSDEQKKTAQDELAALG